MWNAAKKDLARRFGAGALAAAMLCGAMAAAGCSGRASAPPPAPSSQSIGVAPPAPESEAVPRPGPAPESGTAAPAAVGGRVLAMGDEKLTFPDTVLGTREALTQWETLAKSGEAVYFEVCSTNTEEGELSAEDATAIAGILADTELRLYDSLENPYTGGSTDVIGYDAEGRMLFKASSLGNWFLVHFPGEEVTYIFDGEKERLDILLMEHIPDDPN